MIKINCESLLHCNSIAYWHSHYSSMIIVALCIYKSDYFSSSAFTTIPQTTLLAPMSLYPDFENLDPGSFQWTDGLPGLDINLNNPLMPPPTLVSPSPQSRLIHSHREQSMGSVSGNSDVFHPGSGFHFQTLTTGSDHHMMPPGPPLHLEHLQLPPVLQTVARSDQQRITELLKENSKLKKDNMVLEARYTTLLYVRCFNSD